MSILHFVLITLISGLPFVLGIKEISRNVTYFSNIYTQIESNPINSITPKPSILPTSTDYPIPITSMKRGILTSNQEQVSPISSIASDSNYCLIGIRSYKLTKPICDKINQGLNDIKQKDSERLNAVISKLQTSVNDGINYSQDLMNKETNECSFDKLAPTLAISPDAGNLHIEGVSPYPVNQYINPAITNELVNSCMDGYQTKIKQIEASNLINKSELNRYQHILDSLHSGLNGEGACSDHQGVNCNVGEGNVGQVICNDGWTESSVYYWSIKDCIDKFLIKVGITKF